MLVPALFQLMPAALIFATAFVGSAVQTMGVTIVEKAKCLSPVPLDVTRATIHLMYLILKRLDDHDEGIGFGMATTGMSFRQSNISFRAISQSDASNVGSR
jgi:hypothetical protein